MSDYRAKTQEEAGQGVVFEVHEILRKTHMPVGVTDVPGAPAVMLQQFSPVPLTSRQLCIRLAGGSALLEPGAFQYSRGKVAAEMQKNAKGGNWFVRQATSAGTGESAYATRFTGAGEVWTEPTAKHFIAARMDGPDDALLLDDKAFYACEGTIEVSTHLHRSVQGLLSGNGLMQPKISGTGAFVVESPVPTDEVEIIELGAGEELIVDGDLMLMYSASLTVELKPLVRGLRNIVRSGEGLVYSFRGRGTVFLTPTARLGH